MPLACLFAVETRGGRYYGFRSLGAEGRLLQAVRGSSKPHRVANHNFGSWESWEMCPSHGLVNVAWAKALGWSITEMRAVPRTAFRDAEMAQVNPYHFTSPSFVAPPGAVAGIASVTNRYWAVSAAETAPPGARGCRSRG